MSQQELANLRWEHFSRDLQIVRGYLSPGWAVEARVADDAIEAIRPFVRESGAVLESSVWPRNLQIFYRLTDAADVKSFRDFLGVEPARHTRQRPPNGKIHWRRARDLRMGERFPDADADGCKPVEAFRESPAPPPAWPTFSPTEPPSLPVTPPPAVEPPPSDQPTNEAPKAKRLRCITADQAAAEISLSKRWVKDQIKAGALKGYRLGIRWMVDCADFEKFLAARSVGGKRGAQ